MPVSIEQIDSAQVSKACKALLKHVKSQPTNDNNLLDSDEQNVWLQVNTRKMSELKKFKPIRLPLKHSLVDKSVPICLISKDPQKTYKELLISKECSEMIDKVVGVEKFRGKYKPYEARRELAREYSIFLADERVTPLLPSLLGKIFLKNKRVPIPIDMTKGNLKAEIRRALDSTYMQTNAGLCTSIKVGKTNMTSEQVAENILTALPAIIDRIPKKWDNIQSIHLKTSTSVALPIWNRTLDPDADAGFDEEYEQEQDEKRETTKRARQEASKELRGAMNEHDSEDEDEEVDILEPALKKVKAVTA